MELTKYAQAIKTELAMELAKQGSSLEEFEQALQNVNTGDGVYKVAAEAGKMLGGMGGKGFGATFGGTVGGITGGMFGGPGGAAMGAGLGAGAGGFMGDLLTSMPELASKASLAGGALAGLSLDEMDKSVDTLNKALEHEREKIKLVRRITENLKREHGLHNNGLHRTAPGF
jgi:hypothetical protein